MQNGSNSPNSGKTSSPTMISRISSLNPALKVMWTPSLRLRLAPLPAHCQKQVRNQSLSLNRKVVQKNLRRITPTLTLTLTQKRRKLVQLWLRMIPRLTTNYFQTCWLRSVLLLTSQTWSTTTSSLRSLATFQTLMMELSIRFNNTLCKYSLRKITMNSWPRWRLLKMKTWLPS